MKKHLQTIFWNGDKTLMTRIIATLLLIFWPSTLLHPQYMPAGAHFPVSTPLAGLVDAWPMNEGSGTTFFDIATTNPNNVPFQTSSGITFGAVAGWPATPATFSGGNGAGVTPVAAANYQFSGTTPFSVCSWQNISSFAAQQSLAANFKGPFYPQGWQFAIQAGGTVFLLLANVNSSNALQVHQTTASATTGTNFQTCATYDGSRTPAGITIYVGGSSRSTTTDFNTLTGTISGTPDFGLGSVNNGGSSIQGVHGTLGYVSVWSCVLSAGVIATNNAAGPSFTGLHC